MSIGVPSTRAARVMIVGYRWSETDEEYEFHVRAGGHKRWKFEDAIAPDVVDAFKASKPDIWTRYACNHCGCSQFAESGCEEDLEGWERCSCWARRRCFCFCFCFCFWGWG